MDRKMKMGTVAFLALILLVVGVWAYTSWTRTITWTGVEGFTVWDSASGGTEIPDTEIEALGVVTSPLTRDFWIENEGTTEITVTVTGEVPSGCTASWSSTGSYTIPVGTTRVLANLTLTITSAPGSYDWDFTVT